MLNWSIFGPQQQQKKAPQRNQACHRASSMREATKHSKIGPSTPRYGAAQNKSGLPYYCPHSDQETLLHSKKICTAPHLQLFPSSSPRREPMHTQCTMIQGKRGCQPECCRIQMVVARCNTYITIPSLKPNTPFNHPS